MHLRYGKTDIHLPVALELCQFLYRCIIIQVSKAVRYEFSFRFQSGRFIQVVVTAKVVFIQQQVNLFATLAAEVFILCNNRGAVACVPTVITINRYVCRTIDHFSFTVKKAAAQEYAAGKINRNYCTLLVELTFSPENLKAGVVSATGSAIVMK